MDGAALNGRKAAPTSSSKGFPMTPVLHTAELKSLDSGGLALAIIDTVTKTAPDSVPTMMNALGAATFLHRHQTRANRAGMPRAPYSEHPLRNALRALRMGVTKMDIVVAALLHDTVEDCADSIVKDYLDLEPAGMDEAHKRELSLDWITDTFGAEVRRLVEEVTNPLTTGPKQPREVTNLRYTTHVHDSIQDDPDVFILKFVDFADNACGLHHNVSGLGAGVNDAMAARLAAKYIPVTHIFEAELAANYGEIMILLSAEGLEAIINHIAAAKRTLPALLELAA